MLALHERFQAVCVILLQWEMVIQSYVFRRRNELRLSLRVQLPENAELAAQAQCCWKGLSSASLVLPVVFVQLHRELVSFVNPWEKSPGWNSEWLELDTCAVRLEPRGGSWGRAGSRAVRSELCGLGRDSSQWFWTGFRWAQSCHVTVFDEHPTQIVLSASLPGALGKCLY